MVGTISLSCGTDNQGNSFLLDKLLTTKYPLGVVLMELAVQLGLKGATLRAEWHPRLQNEEADALTNSDFHHFSEDKRIPVDLASLNFRVMNELFQEGDSYIEELAALKAAGAGPPAKRSRRDPPLRETQPWPQ